MLQLLKSKFTLGIVAILGIAFVIGWIVRENGSN